jgi:hypothetical protein
MPFYLIHRLLDPLEYHNLKMVFYCRVSPGIRTAAEALRGAWVRIGDAQSPRRVASPSALIQVLNGHPTAASGMLRHLVSQLRKMTSRVYEFSTLAVRHRIHNELLRLAHGGEQDNGAAIISPAPKHTDIASYIGTRREAVSRELSYLTRMGLIERQAGRLVIKDIARLAQMAQGATSEPLQ